ncbi:MAG: MerR family transcriptional regulator, partial [Bacteroidetes bacterium]|nr:MerR family transcriptional regulator [Bacteroidota bacterium]
MYNYKSEKKEKRTLSGWESKKQGNRWTFILFNIYLQKLNKIGMLIQGKSGGKRMKSNFSIKELENLSGIRAHTLRIWEKRYGVLRPDRTDTNIRQYTDKDLKRLLNVSLLNRHGWKISKISSLSDIQLTREVSSIAEDGAAPQALVHELVVAMMEMDEAAFEKTFAKAMKRRSFGQFMEEVVHPFLLKIGSLWLADGANPAQEHFMTNLLRQKIVAAIERMKAPLGIRGRRYMLCLLPGELHELGLLYANYLLKSQGNRVWYLGASVPLRDIEWSVRQCQPTDLVCILTTSQDQAEASIIKLAGQFPK